MIISTPAPNPAPQHCNYILILKEKNYTDERLKKATHLRAVDKVNNQLMCQWGGGGLSLNYGINFCSATCSVAELVLF